MDRCPHSLTVPQLTTLVTHLQSTSTSRGLTLPSIILPVQDGDDEDPSQPLEALATALSRLPENRLAFLDFGPHVARQLLLVGREGELMRRVLSPLRALSQVSAEDLT